MMTLPVKDFSPMKLQMEEETERDGNLSKLDLALSDLNEINSSFDFPLQEPEKKKKTKKEKK